MRAPWLLALGLAALAAGPAVLPTPVPADAPIQFETQREADYWAALVSCRKEVETTEAKLRGERAKVATATVTVNLSCPVIPACPPCPSAGDKSCLLEGGLGAIGGALLGGVICGAMKGPGVTVVK